MINFYKSTTGELADQFLDVIEPRTRRYRLRKVNKAFWGEEAVTALVDAGIAATREEAVVIGRRLQKELHLFSQISGRPFKDERLMYNLNDIKMTLGSWNFVDMAILKENAKMFLQLIKLQDRFHYFRKYKDCFVGSEVVTSMVYSGLVTSRMEAVQLGQVLEKKLKLFTGKQKFLDHCYLYQLSPQGQKMMQKVVKRVAKRNKKQAGKGADFQRDAIKKRIAKQFESDYSEGFLAKVEEVNKEMKERTKKIFTGHHTVVTAKNGKLSKKKSHPDKSHLMLEKRTGPKTVQRRSRQSKNFGRLSSIKENSVLKEITVSWTPKDDEFSFLDCLTLNDESIYTRPSIKHPIDENDAKDFDEYTVPSDQDYSEEDDLEEPLMVKKMDFFTDNTVSEYGSTHDYDPQVKEIVLNHLWSDDVNEIGRAMEELVGYCQQTNDAKSCLALTTVVAYDGVISILLAMETFRADYPNISFWGCTALERLYLVAASNRTAISSSQMKTKMLESNGMQLFWNIMEMERSRSVQAYQAARQVVNILYQDSNCHSS
jgi:hypothetical protein